MKLHVLSLLFVFLPLVANAEDSRMIELEKRVKILERSNAQLLSIVKRSAVLSGRPPRDAVVKTVPRSELVKAQKSQGARCVPFYADGVSVGVRIFSLTKDGVYEKIGFKNGDILKFINKTEISKGDQCKEMLDLQPGKTRESSNTLVLERFGENIFIKLFITNE